MQKRMGEYKTDWYNVCFEDRPYDFGSHINEMNASKVNVYMPKCFMGLCCDFCDHMKDSKLGVKLEPYIIFEYACSKKIKRRGEDIETPKSTNL